MWQLPVELRRCAKQPHAIIMRTADVTDGMASTIIMPSGRRAYQQQNQPLPPHHPHRQTNQPNHRLHTEPQPKRYTARHDGDIKGDGGFVRWFHDSLSLDLGLGLGVLERFHFLD